MNYLHITIRDGYFNISPQSRYNNILVNINVLIALMFYNSVMYLHQPLNNNRITSVEIVVVVF